MSSKTANHKVRKIGALPSGSRIFNVLDVQQLSADQPQVAVKTFVLKGKPRVRECDVFIAGGGMGGIAAAVCATQAGATVCLTEESDWLGGQMTAQGVSALDENHLVEISGATRMYQSFRDSIRQYYRHQPGIAPEAAQNDHLNPGSCWVSWLAFEPQVANDKIDELLRARTTPRNLNISGRTKVIDVQVKRGRVTSVLAVNLDDGKFTEFRPRYCLDATELGDLLPLAGVPYASGAEARKDTGEPHAPEMGNDDNVQDFTYPFVIEYRKEGNYTIAKPHDFERFMAEGKYTLAGYKMFDRASGPAREFEPFWTYRRLIACDNFPESLYKHDLSMINWESNDLRGQNIIDHPAEQQAERLAMAKNLSLGFLYWLQTEAPRDDGGKGYPELFLRTDVLGTSDGLAKYPYIRESRRIKAEQIIVEQDIAAATNSGARSRLAADSVGIGLYPIDIHGQQDVPGAGQPSRPFQLPLGALVQSHIRNLIPACKNIGTTHITNGAYRLHPVEWAIGEAAGTLAGYCLNEQTTPQKVLRNKRSTRQVQKRLLENGAPIFWYSDVPTTHPQFEAIQYLAVTNVMRGSDDNLEFRPDAAISRGEASAVLEKLSALVARRRSAGVSPRQTSATVLVDKVAEASTLVAPLMVDKAAEQTTPDAPVLVSDLDLKALNRTFGKKLVLDKNSEQLSRAEFANWAYLVASSKRFLGRF